MTAAPRPNARRHRLAPAALIAAAFVIGAPAPTLAAWSPADTIFGGNVSNPQVSEAGGGTVLYEGEDGSVQRAARTALAFGEPADFFRPAASERVAAFDLAGDGSAVILTERRKAPYPRVRATFRGPDGTLSAPRTISKPGHPATRPSLAVAADGSAVAAWAWHDRTGWRVQAATRSAGGTFGRPQTLSAGNRSRPFIEVAVGPRGDAAVAYQFGGSSLESEKRLAVTTAARGQLFGPARARQDSGPHADTALAVSASGEVLVVYEPTFYLERAEREPGRLLVARGQAGQPLGATLQLDRVRRSDALLNAVGVAFTGAGDAIVAWVRNDGTKVFGEARIAAYARPAGSTDFEPGRPLSTQHRAPDGVVVAGGGGHRAVVAWHDEDPRADHVAPVVRAATRPAAGGVFSAPVALSPAGELGLWPSVAITDAGDALATWTRSIEGFGSGGVEASVQPAP
jgi:hypothetical protein